MGITFELLHDPGTPTGPRIGRLSTPRGSIDTPAFMPVGTLATVKALSPADVRNTGAQILLVNAYHLYLRPGHELIQQLHGVHRFMNWPLPILSDSGGFQVFSLARLGKVDESGVHFRSHIDGSPHFYTPELAAQVQAALGVDIAMPLDHVLPPDADETATRIAAERTTRWYQRSASAFAEHAPNAAMFAIVQGGIHPALREWHAQELAALEPPGISIGGLSVGESKEQMHHMLELTNAHLPVDKPRYLMGVGSPEDLVEAVARGVDMFDCVLPTRLGRNGSLFTDAGRLNLRNAGNRTIEDPADPGCDCEACANHSLAYLHHLLRNDELLGYRLASIHNIRYLIRLTERMRAAIQAGTFPAFAKDFLDRYHVVDPEVRIQQRERYEETRLNRSQS